MKRIRILLATLLLTFAAGAVLVTKAYGTNPGSGGPGTGYPTCSTGTGSD